MTPASAPVSSATSVSRRVPRWSFVPPPRTRTLRRSLALARRSSAQRSAVSGRSARGIERELLALARCGEDFAWVREPEGIEGVLHAAHDGHIDGRVLERHVAVLLPPDPLLAGDRAADLDAAAADL